MYDPATVTAAGLMLVGLVIAIIRADRSAFHPPTDDEHEEDVSTFGR